MSLEGNALVEESGLSVEFLRKPEQWVSLEFGDQFCRLLAQRAAKTSLLTQDDPVWEERRAAGRRSVSQWRCWPAPPTSCAPCRTATTPSKLGAHVRARSDSASQPARRSRETWSASGATRLIVIGAVVHLDARLEGLAHADHARPGAALEPWMPPALQVVGADVVQLKGCSSPVRTLHLARVQHAER